MTAHPPPYQAPPHLHGNWFTRGGWWFFVHVLSFGILAVVPFTHAAVHSRRRAHVVLAAVVWVLTIAAFATSGSVQALGGTLIMIVFIGGIAGLIVLRSQIYGRNAPARPVPPPQAPGPDPAVARVLAARRRREEARRIVADDPLLARELRIGRPDLPRDYDDGGLVDLNSAPAQVVTEVCGLAPVDAAKIVQARQAAGRFAAVEDVFSWTELPVDVWDRVRDRAVVL